MPRIAVLLLALAACGCPHQGAPTPPTPETLAGAAAGVDLAATGLELSADLSAGSDPVACAILATVGGIGHGVAESLAGEASGKITYGEVVIDASRCGELGLASVDVPDATGRIVEGLASAIRLRVRSASLTCEEKARVDGALQYLTAATPSIVAALAAGELRVTIPAFTAPVGDCG